MIHRSGLFVLASFSVLARAAVWRGHSSPTGRRQRRHSPSHHGAARDHPAGHQHDMPAG